MTPEHRDPKVEIGYETTDVAVRPVVVAVAAVFFATTVIALSMGALLGWFVSARSLESPPASPLAGAYGRAEPPAPRLQTAPLADLETLHAQEDDLLGSYGWVDRGAGVARIPIDRAMALLVERGLPVRAGAAAPEGGR